jgi:hypothetical protein
MPKKYRELYDAKVKGAIPTNADEQYLFDRAQEEERRELMAIAVAEELAKQKGKVGAPLKTGGDAELAARLVAKCGGDIKLARREFIRVVTQQDRIQKKRARERFKQALDRKT